MVDASLLLCMAAPPDRVSPGFHRLVDCNHRPLLGTLLDLAAPVALCIPWGLTQRWLSEGYHDCLDTLSALQRQGHVEFVGTAAYHPILPLLPRPAIERQVAADLQHHGELFSHWSCKGFLPPEMAFGPELLPILKGYGYEWCVVDDAPYSCLNDEPPFNYVPLCADLKVLLRSRMWSRALVARAREGGDGAELARQMVEGVEEWFQGEQGYLMLAMDPECFGHHRSGSLETLRDFIAGLREGDGSSLRSPAELLESYPARADEIPPGSWRMTSEQFWEGEFFAPWQSRYNAAHSHLWELTEIAVGAVGKLQQKLDRSLHSCFYWWEQGAAGGVPSDVARGLRTLLDVIATAAPEDLDKALELVARLDEM